MKTQIIIFAFIILTIITSAQVTVTHGNVLRININSNTINKADTLWHWQKTVQPDRYSEDNCINIFFQNERVYLLTTSQWEYFYMPGWGGNSYSVTNLTNNVSKTLGSFGNVIDVMPEPYINVTPSILLTEKGFWFLGGVHYGCTYVDNKDSTHKFYSESENGIRLTHVLGKVGNKYVIAVRTKPKSYVYDYYLTEFSNLPGFDLNQNIYFPYSQSRTSLPISIHFLKDNLFLVKKEGSSDLDLLTLSGDSLKIVKQSIINLNRWCLSGTKLTYLDYDITSQTFGISRVHFNPIELKFGTKERLLTNLQSIDFDNDYATWIKYDTLHVADLNGLQKEKKYSLTGIKVNGKIFISPPYVFLNQINSITDVYKDNLIPASFSLSQNYPNPFNPETTINYSIAPPNLPKGETLQHVTLKVYDLLGREVATLVDEYKQAGNYKVTFNVKTLHATSLPSGVYFYRLHNSGSYFETKKMLLIQ